MTGLSITASTETAIALLADGISVAEMLTPTIWVTEDTVTEKSDGDTGSGAETSSIDVTLSSSDTGSGSDTGVITASISSDDTGNGAETSSIVATLSSDDTGIGTETSSIEATLSGSDSADGIDTGSITASILDSDTGLGTEDELIDASILSDDTGNGAEASSLAASLSSADTGSGVEGQTVEIAGLEVNDDDTASGTESGSITALVSSGDTGSGAETSSISVQLSSSDIITSTESGLVVASLSSSDTGTSVEASSIAAAIQDGDSTTAVEAEQLALLIFDEDTSSSIESSSLTASINSNDTSVSVESSAISVSVLASDTGSTEDTEQITASLTSADTGAFVEGAPTLTAVIPASVFEMPSLMEIQRQVSTHTNGSMSVTWTELSGPANAGQFKARFDLSFVRPGKTALPPVMAGVQQDRIGIMFIDNWVAGILKAGDRVKCLTGPITGTFDIRNIPEQALGYSKSHHLEVEVVEISQRPTGSYAIPDVYVPSYIRHLYASRVEVLRRDVTSRSSGSATTAWVKIDEIPDIALGIPGEMMCRLDLQFIRSGKDIPLPVYAGRVSDRQGTLFCDINSNLKAGDRIRCISGDITGTYEIKAIPDLVPDLASVNHMEMQIIETSQSTSMVTTS